MEIVNKIISGVHSDNDPNHQPEHTMRRSLNGVIMDAGDGNYIWETVKGNSLSFSFGSTNYPLGWCIVRDRYFVMTLRTSTNWVYLYEMTPDEAGVCTAVAVWNKTNADLGMSISHPIRAMEGFYETQDIQRIYWTDDNNQPRTLNVGYPEGGSKVITADAKFVDLTPILEGSFGEFELDAVSSGGSAKAGNHFFTWRLGKDGYFTDWSPLSNPVHVSGGSIVDTVAGYQEFEGMAPDEVTTKQVDFDLVGLDSDYDMIQVAVFYSNDYNSSEPGVIFYDGVLSGSTMSLSYMGDEDAGTVTIEELLLSSLTIETCKDMTSINKQNIIANLTTRNEIDVSGLNASGLNDRVDCEIEDFTRDVVLDITGMPEYTGSGDKGLFRAPIGAVRSTSDSLYCGMQYYGDAAGGCNLGDGGTLTWSLGEIFTLPSSETTGGTVTSGSCHEVVAKKKYRIGNPTVPAWDDYVWDVHSLVGEYLDYKSPIIANEMRSYPGGEKVRFGIVCFDHYGKPFYARWLNNDISSGNDMNFPKRTSDGIGGQGDRLVQGYSEDAGGDYYEQLNGKALGAVISELDLTDIIDDISGFMIVRAPIVHQYIGSGLIGFTYLDTNDLYSAAGFFGQGSDTALYDGGAYTFYSPEDAFGLKDFSIQPGDELEAIRYYTPHDGEVPYSSYPGYGNAEINVSLMETLILSYQKIYNGETTIQPDGSNSAIGLSHEILSSTKYEEFDHDLVIDPENPTILYQNRCRKVESTDGTSNIYGMNNKHNVLILDIDHTGSNPKGVFNSASTDPIALHCSIKREVASIYGGTSESSLANTLYIPIGHFQKIDATVKANILSGGRYVFNEIEVFGGDHFVCLYDINRMMPDRDALGTASPPVGARFAHTMIFPVESRVNIAVREGNHVAKNQSYLETSTPSVINADGLRYEVGSFNMPEFNYNDGYSSDNIDDYYAAIPYAATLINDHDTMFRFSSQKSYGERVDSFRIFSTNNKIEVDTNYGEVINIRRKFNRIIYWQKDAVGYIPVGERALNTGQFGDPVQLGVGGVFERYDEILDHVGNSNQFGLVESDAGFHWYDSKRKMILFLDQRLQFSQDSIVKGLNNWLEENVDYDIDQYDNPFWTYGIHGGYDPYHKIVFYTFFNPSGTTKTIGIDLRNQKWIGEHEFHAGMWMRFKNQAFSLLKQSFYMYGQALGATLSLYGVSKTAEIQLVLKDQNHESIICDNFEIIGNEEFFQEITLENSDQTIVETIQSYLVGAWRFLGRNYTYRNRKWFGNFPRLNKERFVDSYLIVTFKSKSTETKFLEMKTKIRKAY